MMSLAAIAAPPRFEVVNGPTEWATTATLAWEAGERCTGWTPPTADSVVIERTAFHSHAGRAWRQDHVLRSIQLDWKAATDRTILHEVAHAWAHGPVALLAEGGAEVLADCMALYMGRPSLRPPLQFDHADTVPILSEWSPQESLSAWHTGAGYGSSRLVVRELASEIPLSELLLWYPNWDAVRTAFSGRSPYVDFLLDLAEAGTEQSAWADVDGDGLPEFAEIGRGLDPNDQDSDGDGLFDGAEIHSRPTHASVIPGDGAWHCSGWVPSKPSATWHGIDAVGRWRGSGLKTAAGGRLVQSPGNALVIWMEPEDGIPDAGCSEHPGSFGIVESSAVTQEFVQAVLVGINGSRSSPVIVRFGMPASGATDGEVHLGVREIRWAEFRAERTNVLSALVDVLSTYASLGLAPSGAAVNDELAIRVGEDTLEVIVAEGD